MTATDVAFVAGQMLGIYGVGWTAGFLYMSAKKFLESVK